MAKSDVTDADISYDSTTDEIEALPTITVFRYELDPFLSSITETLSNEDGGSYAFAPSLNIVLKGQTSAKRKEILDRVGRTRVVIFARPNEDPINGNKQLRAYGLSNGLVLSGEAVSGTALADMSGYNLNFTGFEPSPAPFLEPFTSNPFDNFGTVTVDPAYAT